MITATTLDDAANLTPGDIFDLEDAYVESLAKKPRDNRQGYFHPSTIGMCGRRNVYEFIRTPALPTIDPDDLEIFNMGYAVHAMIQDQLHKLDVALNPKKISYTFLHEVAGVNVTDTLFQNYTIGGTTDGLLEIWGDTWKQRGIVEIKSIGSKGFLALHGPKEDHVLQAHLYCFRFDCPMMWIWYMNKDNSRRKVYPIVYQPDLFDEAIKRFESWIAHVAAKTLPPREESFYSCPRCEYRNVCKPDSLAKQRANTTNISQRNLRRL